MQDAGEDDTPQLPADTLQLLQQFTTQRDAHQKHFESLKAESERAFQDPTTPLSMDLFGEDWNASQFWYTEHTARLLARQLLSNLNPDSAIAVVSAPSVYVALRNLLNDNKALAPVKVCLLEYDQRFRVLGADFIPYDFHHPLRLPSELKAAFDHIICDPPFLSEDCQTKTALTVRYLSRTWEGSAVRFISCTGERMESIIHKLYTGLGVKTTTYEPEHSKGLSNEFRCYANFECEDWKWR